LDQNYVAFFKFLISENVLFQNPAFGRGDSVTDLGTFYRECEHVPELVMFKEQNGTENDETLVRLL